MGLVGFGAPDIGARDTRITVLKPTVTYNDDGIEVISNSSAQEFWGKVMEMADQGGVSAFKRLDSRTIKIEADSRSVAMVNILDTLTTDEGSNSYEVVDKYDAQWKFTAVIIAKYKS